MDLAIAIITLVLVLGIMLYITSDEFLEKQAEKDMKRIVEERLEEREVKENDIQ